MASRYLAIRDDIKTLLTAVAGIGAIHGYSRWVKDQAKYLELFKHGNGIHAWEITRRAVSEHKAGAFFRHHEFVLHGYFGNLDAEASEEVFQTLLEDICEKFRVADPADPAASWDYRNGDEPDASPAQVELIDHRIFGNVLCHHAQIAISVTERIVA